MAITLVATVGSATANSYNTTAELTAAAARAFPAPTDFTTADDDAIARAAVTATALLDRERFVGDRVDETQALEWPRRGVLDPTGWQWYEDDVLPLNLKAAHAHLTFWLIAQVEAGVDPFAASREAGLSSIAFGGDLSMTFEKGATSRSPGDRYLATVIRPLLGRLVYAPGVRTVRG